MFVLALGEKGVSVFRIGYMTGLAYSLMAFRWLLYIPFPAGAFAGWLALSAYVALFPAAWLWLICRTRPPGGEPCSRFGLELRRGVAWTDGWAGEAPEWHEESTDRRDTGIRDNLLRGGGWWIDFRTRTHELFRSPGWLRAGWALFSAGAWVAGEMIQARLLSGFPWNLLGTSQFQNPPLIQVASWTGVYGVSFLMVWFSLGVTLALLAVVHAPSRRWAWRNELWLPLIGLIAAVMWGTRTVWSPPPGATRECQLALVQPSIAQRLIWDPSESTNRFDLLLQLSRLALASKPQVLVWPEASVPNLLRYDLQNYLSISNLLKNSDAWMILGADDAEPRLETPDPEDGDWYNSAFLVTPQGELLAGYRKRRLVIFGEYVPLARWVPFLRWLTPIQGGFTPGKAPVVFDLPHAGLRAAILICFEDVFPHGAREHVEHGVNVLINLTNNGWFGESSAQWQHLASAVFRAVENRLPLVRCTNNGVTCWVDEFGRLRDVFRDEVGGVYGRGFQHVRLPLRQGEDTGPRTFYGRHGDLFGWGCLGLTAAVGGWRGLRDRRRVGSCSTRTGPKE
jgi:apolipoprotein N-acyltransferase